MNLGYIENPIIELKQTPDACFPTCVMAIFRANNWDFNSVRTKLAPYVVKDLGENHTENREYWWSDGILLVLKQLGYFTELRLNINNEVYVGKRAPVEIMKPEFSTELFSISTFRAFCEDHLAQKRYLMPWIRTATLLPESHYRQHVVVVYGINETKDEFLFMDPETGTKKRNSVTNMFEALWGDADLFEKIIIIGNKI